MTTACAHRRVPRAEAAPPPGARTIVLAGNPNVGKSVLFSRLTGRYVEVSNYPGTTLETARGRRGGDLVADTPGVYGVSSFNDEERAARDVILGADVVLDVVDAVHLERDLFLTLQLVDLGKPLVVALNFMDEAARAGLGVDAARLERLLGVPVVPTVATAGRGLEALCAALGRARPGEADRGLRDAVAPLVAAGVPRGEALLLLEGDEAVAARLGRAPGAERERIYLARRLRASAMAREVVRESGRAAALRDRLGAAALGPLTGLPLLALVLWALYRTVGVWVAGDVVGFTEERLMQGIYEPRVRALLAPLLPAGSAAAALLVGEFGLLTMTATYLVGLLLPLAAAFYLCLALLEDSGYLPRVAALVDRVLSGIGLNGRAVIPFILGVGCVQLGTITTRLLGTRREKTIATALLNLAVPCSAQIGVIAGMLAAAGGAMLLAYLAAIGASLVLLGTVLDRALPGESSALLIDLPPLRLPRPGNVLRKTGVRLSHFMREATPWFALGALIVAGLEVTGGLAAWQRALAPLVEGLLRLPAEAGTAFVMGMVRRDFGAAGLTELALSPARTVTALVAITLFVPCVASLMVLVKERGAREALVVWAGSWVAAFAVGGVVARVVA